MDKNQTLALFFTRNTSLENWVDSGLFEREKLIYEKHLNEKSFSKIFWLTYGVNDDKIAHTLKSSNKLDKRIEIIKMPRIFSFPKVGNWLYSALAPFILFNKLKDVTYFKSNQMDGAWTPFFMALILNRPFLLRTGYTLSYFLKKQKVSNFKIRIYMLIECFLYKFSTHAIVASSDDKNYIIKNYKISEDKISKISNYIDTDLFTPNFQNDRFINNKIVFVGRLNLQKNLHSLFDAISKTNLELHLYGDGEQRKTLQKDFPNTNQFNFHGKVSNDSLPKIFSNFSIYILPSFYEGMPKTLLEAMACGLLCIGTDVKGINEVLSHNKNGILSKSTAKEDLSIALESISKVDAKKLQRSARQTILDKYSLEAFFKQERQVLELIHP